MGNTSSTQIQASKNDSSRNVCPVDPSARSAWLDSAQQARPAPSPPSSTSSNTAEQLLHPQKTQHQSLASDRVTSSIPRANLSSPTTTPTPTSTPSPHTTPPNSNWIYPSEKMFFEAMKRKNHFPNASDMATVVPIHNAVNERAWSEIKSWEKRFAPTQNISCNGPKLQSFSGDSTKLSPKARVNALLGYEGPFDRHDWVVERCEGPSVEYVIDFYKGKGGGLSFYLDVRPKLNSWEGWRMRLGRLVGS